VTPWLGLARDQINTVKLSARSRLCPVMLSFQFMSAPLLRAHTHLVELRGSLLKV